MAGQPNLHLAEDLADGEAQPLVEGDSAVAVLVHLGKHLLSLGAGGEGGRQAQPFLCRGS